jgi:hypothetical protein
MMRFIRPGTILDRFSRSASRPSDTHCSTLIGTISEYYDRDRPAYYKALQSVRERGMNMTGWLEYRA